MNILALSSSRSGGLAYLQPGLRLIEDLLGRTSLTIGFIPFASVGSYDEYHRVVANSFAHLPYSIRLVENEEGEILLNECDAIFTGGGNTFKLLHDLQMYNFIELIRQRVRSGVPYVGWSAGSNILSPTIRTTNDMPIIEPRSFGALNLFSFQVNPHYFSRKIEGFHGETRDERLFEFLRLNPAEKIVGLPEGTALMQMGNQIFFKGSDGVLLSLQEGEMNRVPLHADKDYAPHLTTSGESHSPE